MQLVISTVTPLDLSIQVEYSCVITLSAAPHSSVLKQAMPTSTIFLGLFRQRERFSASPRAFEVVAILHNLAAPWFDSILAPRTTRLSLLHLNHPTSVVRTGTSRWCQDRT